MIGRAAAAALLLAAFAAPAKADVAGETLLRQFIEAMDRSAEWTAAAALIRSDGDDTLAEGLAVSRQDPAVSINVESLRLGDLREHSAGGGFSASEIEVTGAALVSDATELAIPSATAADVSMPSFEGLGIDVHRLMTSMSQFYTIAAEGEVGEFSIPGATATTRQAMPDGTGTSESRITYRNIRMTGFQDGVMELQEAGPIVVAFKTADQKVDFTIDKVLAERLDLAALARIFDEDQYRDGRGDGVWRPLASRLGYSGFSGTGPDGATFRMQEFAVENIDGRQPDEPFTSDFDRLLDPDIAGNVEPEIIFDTLANMYSAWRVGTVRMDDLALDIPAESTALSLAAMTVTGLSSDGIDSFILKTLAGKGPGGFASLESFEFAGFVVPDFRALMKFAALESDASPQEHEEGMRAAFAALPRLAHMGMQDLAGGASEAEAVRLANFTLDFADWNEIFAERTDIRLEGLEVPRSLAELDPKAKEIMDQLGFEQLIFGMSLADRWAPEEGSDDAVWTFAMQDAADIELSYSLTGVTIDWILSATAAAAKTADPTAAYMQMLADLGLASAALKITDRSLLDRGFGVAARMQGLTVDGPAYRQQMRGALPFLLSAAVPAELVKILSAPLQDYLGGGKTLVAEIAPPRPVSLLQLMGMAGLEPAAIAQSLGLTVTTEAAPR